MKFTTHFKNWLKVGLLSIGGIYFSSCANGPAASASAPAPAPAFESPSVNTEVGEVQKSRATVTASPKPIYRPGLATGQGREIHSRINNSYFERSSETKPKGVATLYYNDSEGVDAMTSKNWKVKSSGLQSAAGGLIEWGVRSGFRYNKNYYANGKRFVLGKEGREYSIVVKNKCHSRLEVVLSVDGLNVLNGQQASVKQRGYLIDAGETLVVKGFRTAEDAVRAFKFSDVQGSLTQQLHGTTKNVGVMGVAVFTQKGVNPWRWTPDVVAQREQATAF